MGNLQGKCFLGGDQLSVYSNTKRGISFFMWILTHIFKNIQ